MKTAVIQMHVGMDKRQNVDRAVGFIERAAAVGAQLAVLPEMFCCPYAGRYFREYGEQAGGEVHTRLRKAAQKARLTLIAGSMPELDGDRVYNTSFVFGPDGEQIARHRKAHLFDIDVKGGQRFFESETLSAGDQITVFDSAVGRLGLCVCFDMRFPELARIMALEGAQMIVVPAAFNMTTGPLHWELMFRQRAVDNQLFTLGVAPAREEGGVYVSYANSMLCSPWGRVLCRADESECMQVVDVDFSEVSEVRAQLPLMGARRTDLYSVGRA